MTARAAIVNALGDHPTLCRTGFGISNINRLGRAASIEQLEKDRRECSSDGAEREVATAMAFLSKCASTITPLVGSYELKHRAERWGRANQYESYVSNGALIIAALALEFPVRPYEKRAMDLVHIGYTSPNALVGVSRRSLNALEVVK